MIYLASLILAALLIILAILTGLHPTQAEIDRRFERIYRRRR